jgi:hypothetical protein
MIRWIGGVLVVGLLVLGFVAWKRSMEPATPSGGAPPAASAPAASEPQAGGGAGAESPPPAPTAPAPAPQAVADASGITWTVPAGWREGGARAMRLATYIIGGPDPKLMGECAVFHFGPGLGGGVDENIDRWIGQFEGTPNTARRVMTVKGLKVTRVEIAGTFLAPGVDMQSQAQLPSWKLLGAIVEGPKGSVFFKFTGPAGVIDRSADDFDGLLASFDKR